MVVGPFTRGLLLLSFLHSVLAQEDLSLRTFALEGGITAAAEDDDYVCSKTKGCNIGCCGAMCVCPQRRYPALLIETLVTKQPATVSVGSVLISVVMAVFPHATTKANVILAGGSSGPMLQHARSTCAAASMASVEQLQASAKALSRPRLSVAQELQTRNLSGTMKGGICKDLAEVGNLTISSFRMILTVAKPCHRKIFHLGHIPI